MLVKELEPVAEGYVRTVDVGEPFRQLADCCNHALIEQQMRRCLGTQTFCDPGGHAKGRHKLHISSIQNGQKNFWLRWAYGPFWGVDPSPGCTKKNELSLQKKLLVL